MKKYLLMVILTIISVLGFTLKTEAATVPSTIETGDITTLQEYVPGVTAYYKPIANGRFVYCEAAGLKYSTGVTMNLVGPVNDGFVFMMNNKPATGDNYKNYYSLQVATWWYKDIINGNNNNLSASAKEYIAAHKDSDAVCKSIYNLVIGAQGYKQTAGTITFSSSNFKWTELNGNYISEPILITSTNMDTISALELFNAPKGSSLINNNVRTDGNGSFQIQVPVSSVTEGTTVNFSMKLSGTYGIGKVYEYYYTSEYQKVILDQVYTTPYTVTATHDVSLTRNSSNSNLLAISKVDGDGNNVSNAGLTLYKGNCVSTSCSAPVDSWTTDGNSKIFTDVEVGEYTLVETSTPDGYRTANKMLIVIDSNDKTYSYSMVDYHESKVRISKTDITGEKELPGATLVLKTSDGKEVDTWISTDSPKYFTLNEGEYTLSETIAPKGYAKTNTIIEFKVDQLGNVYEKNSNGMYTKVDYIKMVNDVKPVVNISKLDSDTNQYVSGAKLVLKNTKGETVATWTSADESYYISVDPGEYILTEESAPEGYVLNPESIYFKVNDDGTLMVKNEQNEYIEANGVIMYNMPKGEIVEVPKTGLSSTLTYVIGSLTLVVGAIVLIKYAKKC